MEFRLQKKTAIILIVLALAALVIGCSNDQPTGSAVSDIPKKMVEDNSMEHEAMEDNSMEMEETSDDKVMEESADEEKMEETMEETSMEDKEVAEEPTVTFVLTGENFKFLMDGEEAPELKVKKGDVVKIEFTSTDGFHDWVVDELDAATKQVKTGESTSVQFTADMEGEFEYYCSVGSHREKGMVGKLVVE